MIGAGRLRMVIVGALAWIVAACSMQLVADLILLATSGYVTKFTPLVTLTLPLRAVLHPLDPVAAYGIHADALRPWMYGLLLVSLLAGAWFVAARHGYMNPLEMGKSEYELPLSRQLTPRLRDLGIWAKHDAARGAAAASRRDKLQVSLLKRFRPDKDLARAMVRRTNGMLVPYRGEQPSARVFLGTYRHLHLLRRRKYNVYARPEQHVVIFGPSGAGKGATQMNPTLLFWNGDPSDSPDGHGSGWPGVVITSTVKHDHVDAALEWRLSLSDQCFVYDPLQSYPEFRRFWVGWDPLTGITNFSEANAVAQALMESESQQSGASSGNEDYFRAQALMVLAPMLLSAAMSKVPFRVVNDWSMRLEAEVADPNIVAADGEVDPNSRTYAVMDKLYEYAEITGDETPLNQMQQVFSKDPREASGVWGSVRKTLLPYNDEKSVQSTDNAFMQILDPKKFYSTPHATLFIIAPEVANEAKRMRPVFAAFITWMIEEAQKLARERNGKLPYPVLANLDEVKNVGAIPGLAHTLSLTRSIGFFVKHAWQDEAQIASAYGKDDAKTITSNSRTWVVLPGLSDPDHLEALARLIGERPVRKRKMSMKADDPDQNKNLKAATAAMIKEVKDNELLIITDNLPPFVIEATRYFQDPVMLARYKLGDARREEGAIPDPAALRAWASPAAQPVETITPDMTAPERPRLTPAQEWAQKPVAPVEQEPALPLPALPLPPLRAPDAPVFPPPALSGAPALSALPPLGIASDLDAPAGFPAPPGSATPASFASPPTMPDPPRPAVDAAQAPALATFTPVPELPITFTPRDGGPSAPVSSSAAAGDPGWPGTSPHPTPDPVVAPEGVPDAGSRPNAGEPWGAPVADTPTPPQWPLGLPELPAPDTSAGVDAGHTDLAGLFLPDVATNDEGVAASANILAGGPGATSFLPADAPLALPDGERPTGPGADAEPLDLRQLFAGTGDDQPEMPAGQVSAPADDLAALFAGPAANMPGVDPGSIAFEPAKAASCPDCGQGFDPAGLDESQMSAVVARHRAAMHRALARPASSDDTQGQASGWRTP